MINGKKVLVFLPAYNAARTLAKTVEEIPAGLVDEIFLVDDKSHDETVRIANQLGLRVFRHEKNLGYGGNQKTCYREALARKADIMVMLHPDYQYDPKLIPAMIQPLGEGRCDVMLGSRILGGRALGQGMPLLKYGVNRLLTFFQNLVFARRLSEYHTGYRAFSRRVLETVPWEQNSDNFSFDAQILAQIIYFGFRIGEIACPARYFPEASTIGLIQGVRYAAGCVWVAFQYIFQKNHGANFPLFKKNNQA